MKIGIIETGTPPDSLTPTFGSYVNMVERFLGADYETITYHAQTDSLPTQHEVDAYVITGSPSSVYEEESWIGRLIQFLQTIPATLKLVGICFGHQAMAVAYGGKVTRSDKGWGIGLHHYAIKQRPAWMSAETLEAFALPASHQDQVVALPPSAQIIAGSDFCPNGMLSYNDRKAISIQLHPEFQIPFIETLIAYERRDLYTDEQVEKALSSLKMPEHRQLFQQWVSSFLSSQ